jgi:hypothetical protein
MARAVYVDLDLLNASRILNLPDATNPQEPATLAQVRSFVEGLAWKDSVRVSTQGNVDLSAPGATIDGISMSADDRVLVRQQTTASQNGIYVWTGAATPATRALDASTFAELEAAVVTVEEGTDAGTQWRQTQVNGTIDTSEVVFTAFAGAIPLASESTPGRIEIATQAETDDGTDDQRAITPLKLTTWSGKTKRYTSDLGDGSATSFTLTHNLGSRALQVSVYRNSGNYEQIECEVRHTSTSALTLLFTAAPTSNQFTAVVTG